MENNVHEHKEVTHPLPPRGELYPPPHTQDGREVGREGNHDEEHEEVVSHSESLSRDQDGHPMSESSRNDSDQDNNDEEVGRSGSPLRGQEYHVSSPMDVDNQEDREVDLDNDCKREHNDKVLSPPSHEQEDHSSPRDEVGQKQDRQEDSTDPFSSQQELRSSLPVEAADRGEVEAHTSSQEQPSRSLFLEEAPPFSRPPAFTSDPAKVPSPDVRSEHLNAGESYVVSTAFCHSC